MGRRLASIALAGALLAPVLVAAEPRITTATARADTAHPRLLFDATEIADLRSKINAGQPQLAWNALKTKVDHHIDPTSIFYVDPAQTYVHEQNRMPTHLTDLAFAYVISGDVRYADHARSILINLAAAGWPAWANNELGEGDLMKGVALAYDWIHDRLSSADRSAITSSLVAELPTLDPSTGLVKGNGFERAKRFSCLDEDWHPRTTTSNNWFGVCGGGSGLALLAIDGEPGVPDLAPYLQVARGRVLGTWNGMFSAQGDDTEGILYAAYGTHNALPFAFAWKRAGGDDLVAAVPGVAEFVVHLAYEQLPGHPNWFVNRNDSMTLSGVLDEVLPLLLEVRSDGVADWLWDHTVGPDGVDLWANQRPVYLGPNNFPDAEGNPCNSICHRPSEAFTILYYRSPSERPRVNPGSLHGPVRHYEKFGLVDIRTGFGADPSNIALTYEAKRNHHMAGHFQRDHGQFTLYGYGERFAIDSGYGHDYSCAAVSELLNGCKPPPGDPTINGGRAIGHNVILVDGQATTQDGSKPQSNLQTIPLVVDAPQATLIRSNLFNGYGVVQRAARDLLFTRATGEPVLLAVSDAVQKYAATPVSYHWTLNTDPANTVLVTGDSFAFEAPSGAALRGMVTAPAPRLLTPRAFINNYEASGYHKGIASDDALFAKQLAVDHLAVMALTPAGETAPAFTRIAAAGGSLVRVDFIGGSAVFGSKAHGSASLNAGAAMTTDGERAKVSINRGESVLAAGTNLSSGGRTYIAVTGGPATVVVSGAEASATGPDTNTYRVYAPQTIGTAKINGAAVPSCRHGDDVVFPCVGLQRAAAVGAPPFAG